MRKIIILILSFLVISCSSSKNTKKSNLPENPVYTTFVYNVGSNEPIEIVLENETVGYVGSAGPEKEREEMQVPDNSPNPAKDMNVIDYRKPDKAKISGYGTVAYNVPNKFTVNKYSTIKLRISRHNGKIESIVIGDRRISIATNGDDVIVETIEVDSLMTAKLFTDSKAFEVELVSNADQKICKDGYTEWAWRVRPIKSGEHYIKLLITISGKDIVVYEKNIAVESNWEWSFTNWVKNWWQIILTTFIVPIIIPIIKWLMGRKKKEEEDKK